MRFSSVLFGLLLSSFIGDLSASGAPAFEQGNQLYSCVPSRADRKKTVAAIRIYSWLGSEERGLIQWDLMAGAPDGKRRVVATIAPARLSFATLGDGSVELAVESEWVGMPPGNRWTFVRQQAGPTRIAAKLWEGEREFTCEGGF